MRRIPSDERVKKMIGKSDAVEVKCFLAIVENS